MEYGAMNPRYLAYCRDHGMTSEKMAVADEATYPGGPMTGYMIWIDAKFRTFCRLFRRKRPFSGDDYRKFDRWLAAL